MSDSYKFCVFSGNPPPRYKTWQDYNDSPIKEGVFIRAATPMDFPYWWPEDGEAWKDLKPEPEWPVSQGSDFKVGDIVRYHPEGALRPHDGFMWEIKEILSHLRAGTSFFSHPLLVLPSAIISELQSNRRKDVLFSNLSRIESKTPAGKPPWILQALEASTGKVLSLEEVRIILKGSSLSQEIIEARGVDIEPIRKVWDHYKHLDKGILGFDGDFRTHVMQDAWQAIKQVLGEK